MSTFDGVVKEYPLISIDRFSEKLNFNSTVFFLSHCHADHMDGLDYRRFFKLLETRGFSKIYASDVSCHLLKNNATYKHLENYVIGLQLEQPTIIAVPDENGEIHSKVTVTLLSAGHCTGSVMFLIEGKNGNVLYTGDIRLPVGSAARMKHMHYSNGRLKPLKSLYVDTTFCKRECLTIPSREKCLSAIISVVEPWLFQGPDHIIHFFCPARYAYDFVFVELFQRYGVKTHVTESIKRQYSGIKFIEDVITSYPCEARLHACTWKEKEVPLELYEIETPCGYYLADRKPIHILRIRLSAMFFHYLEVSTIYAHDKDAQLHKFYFCTHSSLSEVRDLINYLKPEAVYPNVVENKSVNEILDLLYDYQQPNSFGNSSDEPLLGKLKSPPPNDLSLSQHDSLPFFDEFSEIVKKRANPSPSKKPSCSMVESGSVKTDFASMEAVLKEDVYMPLVEKDQQSCLCDKAMDEQISPCYESHKGDFKQSPLKWRNPISPLDGESVGNGSLVSDSPQNMPEKDKLCSSVGKEGDLNHTTSQKGDALEMPVHPMQNVLPCSSANNRDAAADQNKKSLQFEQTADQTLKNAEFSFQKKQQDQGEVSFVPETPMSSVAKPSKTLHQSHSLSGLMPTPKKHSTNKCHKRRSYQHIIRNKLSDSDSDSDDGWMFIRKISKNGKTDCYIPVNDLVSNPNPNTLVANIQKDVTTPQSGKSTSKDFIQNNDHDFHNNLMLDNQKTVIEQSSIHNYQRPKTDGSSYHILVKTKETTKVGERIVNSCAELSKADSKTTAVKENYINPKSESLPKKSQLGADCYWKSKLPPDFAEHETKNSLLEINRQSLDTFHDILGSNSDDQHSPELINKNSNVSCNPIEQLTGIKYMKKPEDDVTIIDCSCSDDEIQCLSSPSSSSKTSPFSKLCNVPLKSWSPKFQKNNDACTTSKSVALTQTSSVHSKVDDPVTQLQLNDVTYFNGEKSSVNDHQKLSPERLKVFDQYCERNSSLKLNCSNRNLFLNCSQKLCPDRFVILHQSDSLQKTCSSNTDLSLNVSQELSLNKSKTISEPYDTDLDQRASTVLGEISTPSQNVVEESLSSDLDESPSLLAPIYKVPIRTDSVRSDPQIAKSPVPKRKRTDFFSDRASVNLCYKENTCTNRLGNDLEELSDELSNSPDVIILDNCKNTKTPVLEITIDD